jgi:hypothetical protein
VAEKMRQFLTRNDISYTLPGRDNQVYLGKDVNKESIFALKKYLLFSYSELFCLAQNDDGMDIEFSFSTLYRYIKDNKEFVELLGTAKSPTSVACVQSVRIWSFLLRESTMSSIKTSYQ